jgi:hypothetical protein
MTTMSRVTVALALLLATSCVVATPAAAADVLVGQEAAAALGAAAAAAASAGAGSAAAAASTSGGGGSFLASLSASALAGWQSALLRDQDLKYLPAAQQLVYACSGLHEGHGHAHGGPGDAPALVAAAAAADTVAPALAAGDPSSFAYPDEADPSTADAFKLHSRPNSYYKIVLDFTGHTMRAGTGWRGINSKGDVPIVTPVWSLDADAAFSATELRAIVSIWRSVAESYSNWDVDVTTEEPAGTDDQGDAWLSGRGVRVAIGNNNGWYNGTVGGVAATGGFGVYSAGPVAFVFNQGT